jgi:hypothetical protein
MNQSFHVLSVDSIVARTALDERIIWYNICGITTTMIQNEKGDPQYINFQFARIRTARNIGTSLSLNSRLHCSGSGSHLPRNLLLPSTCEMSITSPNFLARYLDVSVLGERDTLDRRI